MTGFGPLDDHRCVQVLDVEVMRRRQAALVAAHNAAPGVLPGPEIP